MNKLQTIPTKLPYLKDLPLAHPVSDSPHFEIHLLIGADHYWDIVEDHIVRGNNPTAVRSKLGYLLSGPLTPSVDLSTNILHVTVQPEENSDPQRFWEIEATGTSPSTDVCNDKDFLQCYIDSSITRQPDDTYVARFPWKEDHPPLPTNRELCEK